MEALNTKKVEDYWNKVQPTAKSTSVSIVKINGLLSFRQKKEQQYLARYFSQFKVSEKSKILDLGSGVGVWTTFFAESFAEVVSVERSDSLYPELQKLESVYSNVKTINDDVTTFTSDQLFDVIFIGGTLMYLTDNQVETLLRNVRGLLKPEGIIICRESTLYKKDGYKSKNKDYEVIYRTPLEYKTLFQNTDYNLLKSDMNLAYAVQELLGELWEAFNSIWVHTLLKMVYPFLKWIYPASIKLTLNFILLLNIDYPKVMQYYFVLSNDFKGEKST